MSLSNILVVVVDGLRAAALGAYGNTSYCTHALDEFAARSLILSRCYSPAIDLDAIYEALWRARHPARGVASSESGAQAASLAALLAQQGYSTTLITDEPRLVELESVEEFRECIYVRESAGERAARARDATLTRLASLFASALELVDRPSNGGPQMVWLHARGMHGPWDAPLELQESLLDADELPIESTAPPDFTIKSTDDPDTAFRYSAAYAAEVMVLDGCWRQLMEAVEPARDRWLVLFVGARGYSLGEHDRIGGVDDRLPVEQLHVPMMIQFPDDRGQLLRRAELVSHVDMLPSIAEWIGATDAIAPAADGQSVLPLANPESALWRATQLSLTEAGAGECKFSIRTNRWCLRGSIGVADRGFSKTQAQPTPGDAIESELFVQPDDHWEANDVSKLCREVVLELEQTARECIVAAKNGEPMAALLRPSDERPSES